MPSDQLRASLFANIDAAPVRSQPFDHLYFEDLIFRDSYAELLASLPRLNKYREWRRADALGPDGHSTRRRLFLHPEHLVWLPRRQRRFWRQLSGVLYSDELQTIFKNKFRTTLRRRLGPDADQLRLIPRAMLLRDLGGYQIATHPDTPQKAITVQFYFPRDESQITLGTHFHPCEQGAAAPHSIALPFKPASGYAFAVHESSWHSVPQLGKNIGQRDSLQLNYYIPKPDLIARLRRERLEAFGSLLNAE